MIWVFWVILICTGLYVLLLLLYLWGWIKQSYCSAPRSFSPSTKVSVLIPARNEAGNIELCLKSILQNNYPKYLLEIIVIDDYSEDDTVRLAEQLLPAENGYVLKLSHYLSPQNKINAHKKKALAVAIKEAKGDLIVTTDADCICRKNWLREIVSQYEEIGAKFIVAPVSFIPIAGYSLLYYFQSLDFMMMQAITAAGTRLSIGSMCNGANLAFEKKAFNEVEGYKGIDAIASGDDMLLLYKIKKQFPGSVHYLKSVDAIVETTVQPTFFDFLNQRIRWASKSDKYKDVLLKSILLLVYLFNLCCLFSLVIGFWHTAFLLLFLDVIIVKILIEAVLLIPVAHFYKKDNEMMAFPLLQPFHILYIISVGFLGLFVSYHWKGRKVK